MLVDVRSVLCNTLRVEEGSSVLHIDGLLEKTTFLQVVVEAKNLDSSRRLRVALDRRLQHLILVSSELSD